MAIWILSARAFATPVYYSFAGEVVYSDAEGYALGQSVRYVFRIDRALDGYTVDGNGDKSVVEDYSEGPDWFINSFYSEYLGGDALIADNPDSPYKETSFAGIDRGFYGDYFSAVRGSNTDASGFDLIDIYSDQARIGDWTVGQALRGENFVENAEGSPNSSYSSLLTLTEISDYNPLETTAAVPEPSTWFTYGLGLMALGAIARRRKSR